MLLLLGLYSINIGYKFFINLLIVKLICLIGLNYKARTSQLENAFYCVMNGTIDIHSTCSTWFCTHTVI